MEDLDDDAGAVEHLASRRALEVARLARREIVIDGDEVHLGDGLTVAIELGLLRLVLVLLFLGLVVPGGLDLGGLALDARLVLLLRGRAADVAVASGELAELLQLAFAEHGAGLEVRTRLRDL